MAVTRARAEEYLRLAEDCLALARSASTEDEAPMSRGAIPPALPAESQPAARQQQQVQDKDKKK
jgi:hypothetical protein